MRLFEFRSRLLRFLFVQGGFILLGIVGTVAAGSLFLHFALRGVWIDRFSSESRVLGSAVGETIERLAETFEAATEQALDEDSLEWHEPVSAFPELKSDTALTDTHLYEVTTGAIKHRPDRALLEIAISKPGVPVMGATPDGSKKRVRLVVCTPTKPKKVGIHRCIHGDVRINLRRLVGESSLMAAFRVDLFSNQAREPELELFPLQSADLRDSIVEQHGRWMDLEIRRIEHPSGDYFIRQTPLAGTPWTVVVSAPVRAFRAETRRLEVLYLILLTSVAGIIFGLNAEYFRRRVIIPMLEIEHYASLIAAELGRQPAPQNRESAPELNLLQDLFKELLDDVKAFKQSERDYHRKLEEEVSRARTAFEKVQRDLVAAEKLAVTSKLMGQIAHEIRNPLTSMALAVDNIHARMPSQEGEVGKHLLILQSDITRLCVMLDQFLKLGKRPSEELVLVSLNDVLTEAVNVMGPTCANRGITIERALDPGLLPAGIMKQELLNCFINLLRNACEAIGSTGGTIRITTRTSGTGSEAIIEDSGPGISKEMESRVFDLFFSTKPEGTGFGLAQVSQAVTIHDGTIFVEKSDLGGARFRIEFPF